MQLHAILIVGLVLLAQMRTTPEIDVAPTLLAAWGPLAVAGLLAWIATRLALRSMDRHGDLRSIGRADRVQLLARLVILVGYATALLGYDWLALIRSWIGDLVLIDELIAMLPAVLGFALLWWIHEPVDRRIREAVLMRRIDMGMTVHRSPTRLGFVWHQVRTHLLLLLVPLLAIVAASELVDRIVPMFIEDENEAFRWAEGLSLAAGLSIFAFAPLMARFVLSVERLPEGEHRRELIEVCARHNVRVRELLLWKTGGTMLNAAVMGLVGRLRYVLISDALLESMSRDELVAVMAHEIGHVRRHHLPWMVVTLLGILLAVTVVTTAVLLGLDGLDVELSRRDGAILEGSLSGLGLLAAFFLFGWMSRRYERQADTFAVQHISEVEEETRRAKRLTEVAEGPEPPEGFEAHAERDENSPTQTADPDGSSSASPSLPNAEGETSLSGPPRVTPMAVLAMHEALGRIARLNAISPRRRSWRHGSIQWRQDYLRSLVGRPIDALPIDRTVGRLKLASGLLFIISIASLAAIEMQFAPAPGDPDGHGNDPDVVAELAEQPMTCGSAAAFHEGFFIFRIGGLAP